MSLSMSGIWFSMTAVSLCLQLVLNRDRARGKVALAEVVEAEVELALAAVEFMQVTPNGCLLYTSPSPRDRG